MQWREKKSLRPHDFACLTRRAFMQGGAVALSSLAAQSTAIPASLPGAQKLPRWRGFNLPDRMHLDNSRFHEEDFDIISQWGFDFVRLPLDYRIWSSADEAKNDAELESLTQVVGLGNSRGLHVNLCLHRAPGYSVQGAIDSLNLWGEGDNGEQARARFYEQWRLLASRFKSFSSKELSFNLVNEPKAMPREKYLAVVKAAVSGIRAIDPSRLVIVDGCGDVKSAWMAALPELSLLNVAESLHVYFPDRLTQYKSSWYSSHEDFAAPTWPTRNVLNGFLCGPGKSEYHAPLEIYTNFDSEIKLSIEIELVNASVILAISADGEILDKHTIPCKSSDSEVRHFGPADAGWNQCLNETTVSIRIPAGAKKISLEVIGGDWMTFTKLVFETARRSGPQAIVLPVSSTQWTRNPVFHLSANGDLVPENGPRRLDEKAELEALVPWRELRARGVGVHVGEFGVNNQTPHKVTLAWMRDQLDILKRSGFGWALWELRGPWGVLDSERSDVRYEDHREHKLDRDMLQLLLAS